MDGEERAAPDSVDLRLGSLSGRNVKGAGKILSIFIGVSE